MEVLNAVCAQFSIPSVFLPEYGGVKNGVRKGTEVVGVRRQLSYVKCNYTFYCIAV